MLGDYVCLDRRKEITSEMFRIETYKVFKNRTNLNEFF